MDGYIKEPKNTYSILCFWRTEEIIVLLGKLYKDSTLHMERKYQTFRKALKYYATNKCSKRYEKLLEEINGNNTNQCKDYT